MFAPTRRAVLARGGALLATSLARCGGRPASTSVRGRLSEAILDAKGVLLVPTERARMLGASTAPSPVWSYADAPFPVLRTRVGQTVNATLANGLKEHTSIHWHGVRVTNAM